MVKKNNPSIVYGQEQNEACRTSTKTCLCGSCVYAYELAYMLDREHKYAFMFGTSDSDGGVIHDLASSIHDKYHKIAFSGKPVTYEWSLENHGAIKHYQSTLLPLINKNEKNFNVLGVVRDITKMLPSGRIPSDIIKDYGAKTFAQVLLKTKEDEKKKISSALHDELGSAAVVLTSILSVLQEDIKEDKKEDALTRTKELNEEIKETIEKLKNIVVMMRPPSLEAVGLDGAIKEIVENLNKFANVRIIYKYEEKESAEIDDEVKIMLFRVVQEGLSNVIKYSKATEAKVLLQNLKNIVRLEVSDNGVGFKRTTSKKLSQLGLLGMEEMVKYLGGKFQIKTALGKGTVINVSCPKVVYKVDI
ncbi:Histidine kinase [Elusimicrobium minutum Pei191]|uniref:histidine kinase n=1 Tax=Elusimicrobium minutum (strain Pei191) TaxID=445932 RepID=B2KBW1_ELUMP|nr:sensor histidine kinase [Elusimicrobium minutum]ACC97865.1 Histidine kinase [Elusimicrobium minutum Pei191]